MMFLRSVAGYTRIRRNGNYDTKKHENYNFDEKIKNIVINENDLVF